MKHSKIIGFFFVMLCCALPGVSRAACTTPAGVAGDQFYNTSYNVMQYCNGTNWINMGAAATSLSLAGMTDVDTTGVANGNCLVYNSGTSKWEDGACGSAADNLGNHTATGTLYMAGNPLWDVSSLYLRDTNGNDGKWAGINTADNVLNFQRRTLSTGALEATVASLDLTSGAFTATSFAGSGVSLTSLNASNLGSGTVPTARLGSGTANSTTYLRGDGTWATVTASGDNLGDHTATQNIILGANWLNGDSGSEGISVGTTGAVRIDQAGAGNTYDVWLQGGASASAGTARRIALLGTEAGQLYLNYNTEYASGVIIGGTVNIPGTAVLGGTVTITAGALTDSSILAADIATSAVTTTEILDGTITAADIAANAVGTSELANGSVTAAKLAAGVGGVTAQTTASCFVSSFSSCTTTCPAGYFRSGCGSNGAADLNAPAGAGCTCSTAASTGNCFIYCVQ